MEAGLFLTPDEMKELTGIKIGREGKTREALQIHQLRTMGIPFFENAAGRPMVSRAFIEGAKKSPPPKAKWVPKPLQA